MMIVPSLQSVHTNSRCCWTVVGLPYWLGQEGTGWPGQESTCCEDTHGALAAEDGSHRVVVDRSYSLPQTVRK